MEIRDSYVFENFLTLLTASVSKCDIHFDSESDDELVIFDVHDVNYPYDKFMKHALAMFKFDAKYHITIEDISFNQDDNSLWIHICY